jgi:glycosyltransferase involved in cell wall biosynthesis/peptidoglycan/xylan/chitin deacetylase (PgdA/CDA1 family)
MKNFPDSLDKPDSDSNSIPLRIGILMDYPSPHMVALLNALAERDDCSAEVIYLGRVSPNRKWGMHLSNLAYRFLRGLTFMTSGLQINPGLFNTIQKMCIDVWVINTCYDSPSTLVAAWWLGRGSTPWVYMNEPPRPRNQFISVFKSLLLRFVLGRAWGIIGMGERAVAMYRMFLKDDRPMTSIPYYINLEDFFSIPIADAPIDGHPLKFLTCCQMIQRKGIDVLFKACERLKNMNWQLTLVGDGPLRHALENEFIQHFPPGCINFVGEVSYEKRHLAFSGQHVFVLPSRWDGWGMVVPEALAAGLPVVATDQVISAHEFVINEVNGFVVPVNDPLALADKMEYFIRNSENIPQMSFAARKALENYDPEVGAERLVHFLADIIMDSKHGNISILKKGVDSALTWRALTTPKSIHTYAWRNIRHLAKEMVIRGGNVFRPNSKPMGHRILVYHLVLKEDRKSFEEQIKFLKDHFVVCSISKTIQASRSEDNGKACCASITFDDGFQVLMRDCLDILGKYNIKASFFVSTGFLELSDRPDMAAYFSLRAHHYNQPLEPMRPEDVQTLVKLGHEVGSHGISHISISALSMTKALSELNLSRQRIAEWTGISPTGFAYPYGHTVNVLGDPIQWIRLAGYSYGFTLQRGKINKSTDPFLIPRDHIEGNWPLHYLKYFLFP